MKVSYTYEVPMGHRLKNHQGNCRFLHGHNYLVTVSVENNPNAEGMVIDYHVLKTTVRNFFNAWDHALVLQDTDPVSQVVHPWSKLILRPYPPTAEMLAAEWLESLQLALGFGIVSISVRETRDTEASL